MKYNTILFDFDGTLVDTNELIHKSFMYTFDKFGVPYEEDTIAKFNGPPLAETFSTINPELAEEMMQTYLSHNLKYHDQYIRLYPNVIKTLEALKENNCQLAIVTAKLRDSLDLGLKITKIADYFDAFITINDVENPKPHPEPVVKALEALKASPGQAIMIGDNSHDIVSGNQAGVSTVGVSWSLKGAEYIKKYEPTYMVDDMAELLPIIGV